MSQHTKQIADLAIGQTPVAYFVFKRPQHTRVTFAAIRAYRPAQLFLIADGPRANHPGDVEKCSEVRRIVTDIDWPCDIKLNFSDANLGCGCRVSSGLDWVFSLVDRAIILEDDCFASPEFFSFCDDLLERYRDHDSIWVVSGNSYQPQFRRGGGSYYFSKYPDTWGWATWRRAWRQYQHNLPFLETWKNSSNWKKAFPARSERKHFERVFHLALSGAVDTWDYQWVGCVSYAGGLSATPNANLVKNIGFDMDGTHTKTLTEAFNYELTSLGAIIHPSKIEPNVSADEYHRLKFQNCGQRSIRKRILDRAKYLLHLN